MSVPPSALPPPGAASRPRSPDPGHTLASRAPFWAALAWSAAALGLALGWWAGVVTPGLAENMALGGVLTQDRLGLAVIVTSAVGAVGVALALLLPSRSLPRLAESLAWVLSGVLLVVYVDFTLLMWLGYTLITPVLVWFEPALGPEYVTQTFSSGLFHALFFALGTGIWAWAALARRRHRLGGCLRCGRGPNWTPQAERALRGRALRTGRIAVLYAVALSLVYPAVRIPWVFGFSTGMEQQAFEEVTADPVVLMIGIALGAAGVVGSVFMLGLVQGWGVRFPRWAVGLSGRRVPVTLAVVPAALVASALVGAGRSIVVQLWYLGGITPELAAHAVVFVAMPLWAVPLAVAVVAYAVRRRAECGVCERGLAEAWPVTAPPLLSRNR